MGSRSKEEENGADLYIILAMALALHAIDYSFADCPSRYTRYCLDFQVPRYSFNGQWPYARYAPLGLWCSSGIAPMMLARSWLGASSRLSHFPYQRRT